MKKEYSNFIIMLIGTAFLGIGLFISKNPYSHDKISLALPYIFIAVGCGVFGHGAGNVFQNKRMKNKPNIQKMIEIEKMDERNALLTNSAKAKAFDLMTYLFALLMLAFTMLEVELTAVLLLVFSYLFVQSYRIYYRFKYEREK